MLNFFKKLLGKKSSNDESAPEKDGKKTILKDIEMKHVNDILLYLKKDHYKEGYVAALKVPDKKMAEISLEAVKADYLGYIQKIENRYVERRKETEKIKMLNEANGLYDLVKENDKVLETIDSEMKILAQIREEVIHETENGYFQLVIKTFWRGFYAGMYDVLQGKVISGSMDVNRADKDVEKPITNNSQNTNQ